MADLREALEAQFEAAENGELDAPIEREIEVNDDPIEAENRSQESSSEEGSQEVANRDEKGRFTKTAQANQAQEPVNDGQADIGDQEAVEVTPSVQRPTTWKKEYLAMFDKIEQNQQLTPDEAKKFLNYVANQRENEFKAGVSAYKREADNARSLIEAISPFVPELQKQNIHPAAWINNLGRAHMILSQAPMPQKIDMFQKLAADYGIQFNPSEGQALPQAQLDPQAQYLYEQLQRMNQEVSSIKGRYEQEENQRLMSEIGRVANDKEKYPYFEVVREIMAQKLEKNEAADLDTAYQLAVEPFMNAFGAGRTTSAQPPAQQKAQQVAKAKATAVSPKSVTPNGMVASGDKNKDRKSLLESQFSELTNRF